MGHEEGKCPQSIIEDQPAIEQLNNQLVNANISRIKGLNKPQEHEDFGSWVLVKKPVRKRTPRPEKSANAGGKGDGSVAKTTAKNGQTTAKNPNPRGAVEASEKRGSGSRLSALNFHNNDPQEHNMPTNKESEAQEVEPMESEEFQTIDLGLNSQVNPKIADPNLSFSVGKIVASQSKSNPSKTAPRIYQEKRKGPTRGISTALTEINPNVMQKIPNASRTQEPIGKENSLIVFKANSQAPNQAAINEPPQALRSQSIDVTHVSPTPQHHSVIGPYGEDPTCGSTDGRPLHNNGEPPDSCARGESGLEDRGPSNATGASSNPVTTQ